MENEDFSLCMECGGHVSPVAKPGRTVQWMGSTYDIPADLVILTCDDCGATWTGQQEAKAIDEACRRQRDAAQSQARPSGGQVVLGPFAKLYTQKDAGDLTGLPQQTVSRWVSGSPSRGDGPRLEPVVRTQGGGLSFLDVAELAMLASFRRAGVTLKNLRIASQVASEILGETHPFCTNKLRTDGNRVFAKLVEESERSNDILVDLVTRQIVIPKVIEPVLEQFDFEPNVTLPRRWWPMGKKGGVVIDPEREMGKPIMARSGINAMVLVPSAGETREAIARCYETDEEEVQQAEAYQRHRHLIRGAA